MARKASPTQEMINEMVLKACLLGKAQIENITNYSECYLKYEYYLSTVKIVREYTDLTLLNSTFYNDTIAARRQAVKDKDNEAWRWASIRIKNFSILCKLMVQANLYQAIKIGKSVIERTEAKYS
jgi:hypothetical protein